MGSVGAFLRCCCLAFWAFASGPQWMRRRWAALSLPSPRRQRALWMLLKERRAERMQRIKRAGEKQSRRDLASALFCVLWHCCSSDRLPIRGDHTIFRSERESSALCAPER